MIKRYFEHTEQTKIRNMSELVFEEISSGIYHIKKDRYVDFNESNFTNSDGVVKMLTIYKRRITIENSTGVYANFVLSDV